MMMSLGMFVFRLQTLPYQEMQRRSDWRHPRADLVGTLPTSQFVGPGTDEITLTGTLLPALAGSYSSLAAIRAMADQGDAWPLLDGVGRVIGTFTITSLDTTAREFFENGIAQQTDFSIQLSRVPDA